MVTPAGIAEASDFNVLIPQTCQTDGIEAKREIRRHANRCRTSRSLTSPGDAASSLYAYFWKQPGEVWSELSPQARDLIWKTAISRRVLGLSAHLYQFLACSQASPLPLLTQLLPHF